MSLYPTLEDLHVGKMVEAQVAHDRQRQAQILSNTVPPVYPAGSVNPYSSAAAIRGGDMYPSLGEYMGLTLTPEMVLPFPNVASSQMVSARPAAPSSGSTSLMQAPLTGNSIGLKRAEVTHGIRQVVLCKDAKGKAGMRLYAVNNGVFVSFVMAGSPAALSGLRFGDQILQVDTVNCAGWSTDKAMKSLSSAPQQRIELAVRDRPFERTITMVKDSGNHVGFGFKDGKIEKIVRDSSAARNGILTDHQLLEVNGQNVIGMKDKQVLELLEQSAHNVTITIMPSVIFQHIVKNMSSDLVRKSMDHSVPFV